MDEQTLKQLSNRSQPLTHKLLRSLSGLNGGDLAALQKMWLDIDVERRRQIARSLVEMAEDDVEMDFEDILKGLLNDADAQVRATAVGGLWESHDERLVDPLITLMQKDPSSQVRAVAAETLGHFGMLGAEEKLHGGRAERLLAALLQTFHSQDDPLNTEDVRRNALESAAFFSDDDQVMEAIAKAYRSPDVGLRAAAISAMGLSFGGPWDEEVSAELSSPHPELRYEAAQAAGLLWIEAAVPKLIELTKDPDREVQLMAIWSLGEIATPEAKTALIALARSDDEAIREAVEEALEEVRFSEDPLAFLESPVAPKAKKPK